MNLDRITRLIGQETPLEEVARELCYFAQDLRPPVTGALQLTCSDEAEQECIQAFQRGFVNYLLPSLKFSQQAPFRIANPGARYEWGCMDIAESHFATRITSSSYKLMVAKVNGHVALDEAAEGLLFGQRARYDECSSTYCGALNALLAGGDLPFLKQLEEDFTSDGLDRLAILREQVDPNLACLHAAVASARIQARHAVIDVQDHPPSTPTLWLVIPSVTLNRAERDTEILCGLYVADDRGSEREVHYLGLGDDPRGYEVEVKHGRLTIRDEHIATRRAARDHRRLAMDTWEARRRELLAHELLAAKISELRSVKPRCGHPMVKEALRTLMPMLLEFAPVPTAIMLFGHGITGIHHAHRVRSLSHAVEGHEDARRILAEFHDKLDQLPHEDAHAVLELLLSDH